MSTEQMRIEIAKLYGASDRIKTKLKGMPDLQVVAFYRRLQRKGQIQ